MKSRLPRKLKKRIKKSPFEAIMFAAKTVNRITVQIRKIYRAKMLAAPDFEPGGMYDAQKSESINTGESIILRDDYVFDHGDVIDCYLLAIDRKD